MRSRILLPRSIVMAATLGVFLSTTLQAQPMWVNYHNNKSISVEWLKANFDGDDNTTFLSSATFLTIRFPINERLSFVGEVSVAHGELDFSGSDSKTTFGNPYLGLEIRPQDSPLYFELGVRVPAVSSNNLATFIGSFADADRFEAFRPDLLTLEGMVNLYRMNRDTGFFLRLRGGSSLFFNTDAGLGQDDAEWFLVGDGFAGIQGDKLRVEGGLTSRLVLTEDDNLGERTFFQLGAIASLHLGQFRPGVHFRLPLDDDLTEIIDWVAGINLHYILE
ncbi:MAG: hypothetical protein ACE5IR_11045 [bacterium]